ncbi:MAG: hypothetical protein HQL28_05105 [Candidatus Omnitrophica bacterium]|nr:hypothetical protein [Candidatus Omnitrophota bacterium]
MKRFLPVILIIFASHTFRFAEDIKLSFKSGKDKIYFSDKINLDLVLDEKGVTAFFPEKIKVSPECTLLRSEDIKSGFIFFRRIIGRRYLVGVYTTGTEIIPSMEIQYRRKGDAEWKIKKTEPIVLQIHSLLTGKEKDIYDIKGKRSGKGRKFWFTLLAMIIGCFALIYGSYAVRKYLYERKLRNEMKAQEIAFKELDNLRKKELPDVGKFGEYYVALTDIIRKYIDMRFSYRSGKMTTEEFLEFVKTQVELSDIELQNIFKKFFPQSDFVKFADYMPDKYEAMENFKRAYEIVERTKPVEETKNSEL